MFTKYYKYYSNSGIKNKLAKLLKRVSKHAFRQVVTLMVMLKSEDVPKFAKVSIMCVLGYLICPIDIIPDFLPIGLLDDFAAITILVAEMSIYITPEMEEKVDEIIKQF
jgi:uncharacterized membrane protein YkvA (DUF1232 family)